MYKEQLQTLIKYLQCKQAKFAAIVANKLSLGICSEEYLNRLVLSSYILEVFYRYQVFAEDVTNIQEVTITETTDIITVQVNVGATRLATYTGVGDVGLINQYLYDVINSNTSVTSFYAVILNDILYIYTYSDTYTFTDLVTFKFLTSSVTEYQSTAQEGQLSNILELWNCLTLCELSNLKDKFLQIIQ